jgi:inosine-uridine nucleoside N-ribohydrolase
MTKVLVDTDLNFASDDFQALLLLLTDEQIQISGLSCAAGNTFSEEVLVNVSAVADLCGLHEVPIAAGIDYESFQPRRHEALQQLAEGRTKFIGSHGKSQQPRLELPDHAIPGGVHSNLREILLQDPTITAIVCLAPLTNLAAALDNLSEDRRRSLTLWIMGGNIELNTPDPKIDFNFWYDPPAASKIMRSGCNALLFPYETCRKLRSDPGLASSIQSPRRRLSHVFSEDFGRLVRQHGPTMPLCDHLVALALMDNDIVVDTRPATVDVERSGPYAGRCVTIWNSRSSINVVTGIDSKRAVTTLLSRLECLEGRAVGDVSHFLGSLPYTLDAMQGGF